MDNTYIIINGELYHHGVKGMKWGIRRYQRRDGSLTPAGKKHVAELMGRLLDPDDSENTANRQQVAARYKQHTEKFGEKLDTIHSHVYRYAEATLKDLGFDTERGLGSMGAIAYVRNLFESDDMIKRLSAARDAADAKREKDAIDEISKMSVADRKSIQEIADGFATTEWRSYSSVVRRNIGGKDVEIDVQARRGTENYSALSASKFLKKYDLDNDRENVAKEYYDGDEPWQRQTRDRYSRKEFKNSVRLTSMTVDPNNDFFEAWWDDGDTYGGHALTGEGRMSDLRIKYGGIQG